MLFLAGAQFLGIAIAQTRRMYIGAVIVLIILVLLGETKKFAKLFVLFPASIIVILLATTVGGLEISGRVGKVNLEFFREHIRSIHDSEGTPGSAVESRFLMADEAFEHFRVHPVLGVGFGQPLLTDIDENNGAVTRMPHNSSIKLLGKTGDDRIRYLDCLSIFSDKEIYRRASPTTYCETSCYPPSCSGFFCFTFSS